MRIALAVLAAALIAAPPAAALPTGPTPLPGSTFQGGDGNQDDPGAPNIDWQGLQTADRVTHSPDPNADDSAFVGGSKEEEPGDWDFTTERGGVSPAKVNVLDAWTSVDQPAGDTFLYLAFAREKANGDAYVAFELNRDGQLWDNGRTKIPCRRTGDLLVVLATHGNSVDMTLQRWTTTVADPGTSCAIRGTLSDVATIPAGSAQGDANGGAIANHLPSDFFGATIPDAGQFAEASLNLTALLQADFQDRCFAFTSVWMHSRSSESARSNMQDYIAPRPLDVRSCSAAGTKFYDANANGAFDSGEHGLSRFVVWADYDNDGVRDPGEPFAVTDASGRYVIDDIQGGSYRLREQLLQPSRRTSWLCTYPNASTPGGFANGPGGLFACGWGPISTATEPYARDRDFGNWLPARLTVEKRLWPAGSGTFDLKVNGQTVLPAAGDRARTTVVLLPGTYDVSESAVPPTNAADFRSTVRCRRTFRQRGTLRSGPIYTGLRLRPGDNAKCWFINVKRLSPAIAIQKTGPVTVTAGDTIDYTLYVTNPGDVRLPARTVRVTDDTCDHAPKLVTKNGDGSPRTLDPGDTWTYSCSHDTAAPGATCVVSSVTNTATASAGPISDDDSGTTTLECPDVPPEPPLPDPGPEPTPTPGPGPTPPTPAPLPPLPAPEIPSGGGVLAAAGSSGRARLAVPSGCVSRVREVTLSGNRIRGFSVSVDGRPVRRGLLRILQRRATLLSRVLRPGRHRVTVRVTFQRGSGTAAVTLARTITICPAAAPRFTG
jgi:hypothetical protein